MLDSQGRVTIISDLLKRSKYIKKWETVNIYLNMDKKILLLNPTIERIGDDTYFISTRRMDEKGRIFIPTSIRNCFPKSKYLPAERNGEIYILIIE